MKYYQIKDDPANYAHGELFTEAEMQNLNFAPPKSLCRLVEIKKSEVHFFFGVRLPDEDAQITVIESEVR